MNERAVKKYFEKIQKILRIFASDEKKNKNIVDDISICAKFCTRATAA